MKRTHEFSGWVQCINVRNQLWRGGINCGEVETIGIEIHKGLDGVPVSQAVVQRNMEVRNLSQLSIGVKVNNET